MTSSSHNNFEESMDENFDQYFDQTFDEAFDEAFENLGEKTRKRRVFIERNREEGHLRLWNDYFSDAPTYP